MGNSELTVSATEKRVAVFVRNRAAVVVIVTALYVAFFIALYREWGSGVASLSAVPVALAGWLFGLRGGIIAVVAGYLLNVILSSLMGSFQQSLFFEGGPGTAMLLLVGVAGGYARELLTRWQAEVSQRRTAEAALAQARDQLELLVQARTGELKAAVEELQVQLFESERMESALEANLTLLESITHAAPNIISILDVQNKTIVFQNRSLARELGYSDDEARQYDNTNYFSLMHPDDLQTIGEVDKAIGSLQGSEVVEMEYRLRDADGNWRWFRARALVFERDTNGQPTRVLDTSREITGLKLAEQSLRESEERFRSLVQNTLDLISVIDSDGTIRYISPSAHLILGYPAEELSGKTLFDIVHPDDASKTHNALQHVIEKPGEPLSMEFRVLNKQGMWRHIETVGSNQLLNNAIRGIVLNSRDITDRIEADERIRREAARAESLARAAARLNAQLDLPSVMMAISDETSQALNVRMVGVSLYDPKTDVLVPSQGTTAMLSLRDRVPPVPRQMVEEAVERFGDVVVLTDFDLLAGQISLAGGSTPIRTLAFTRMMRDHALIGLLVLITDEDRTYTQDEMALIRGLADLAAQAIDNARLYNRASQRLRRMQALRAIDTAITSSVDIKLTLGVVIDQVREMLGVDAASVLKLFGASQTLAYVAGKGYKTNSIERSTLRLGQGLAGRAALERRIVTETNLRGPDSTFSRIDLLKDEKFAFYVGVPLVAKGQVKGVLDVFHREPLEHDAEWMEFLETLAGQAAIAIDNAGLFDDLQQSNAQLVVAYDATLEGWSRALDLRDEETEGHTQRVAEMTLSLARAAGLSDDEVMHAWRGAILHDIGKMGIPDNILLKPGLLTDEERAIMQKHPQYAYNMLSPIAYLRPALDIPYAHHEKWDGTGYPRGLAGESIPLVARLFAVVDVWDALRSNRPYRKGWSEDRVLEHLEASSGTHFDPFAVELFMSLIRRN